MKTKAASRTLERGVRALSFGVLLAIGGCGDPAGVTDPGALGLVFPAIGTLNEDIFHVYYPGHDSSEGAGVVDYQCGLKAAGATPAVPNRLDASLISAPFIAYLDSAVMVVAAAAGTVTAVHDGEPDVRRGGGFRPTAGLGNFLSIAHGNGVQTTYGNLKQGSIAVTIGQEVASGTEIGEFGTSGEWWVPSVAFGVSQDGASVDPFAGPCGSSVTQWADQLPYQNRHRLIASGTSYRSLSVDDLRQPEPTTDTVLSSDPVSSFWVVRANVEPGPRQAIQLIGPSGEVIFVSTWVDSYWGDLVWKSAQVPVTTLTDHAATGTFRWQYWHGESFDPFSPTPSAELLASREVELVQATVPRAVSGSPADAEARVLLWGLGADGEVRERRIR